MELDFNTELAKGYHSNAQIARVLTESWMADNMYCPRCGNSRIKHFSNNRPVADFYCPICRCEYELKSKKGVLADKINDGAYATMIERITSNQNPDFFFMGYDIKTLKVKDLLLIPKHFFVPDIIQKRKPLSETARRAGWIGCNIIITKIPQQGRINIIKNGIITDSSAVVEKVNRGNALETKDLFARGWLMDILNCINLLPYDTFSLSDMYCFEEILKQKYPQNNHIKPKIRQQLQRLRDKGFIKFMGNGKYKKV